MSILDITIAKLQKEKMDLNIKIDNLSNYIKKDKFLDETNRVQQILLPIQLDIMMTYYDILSARIYNLRYEKDKEEN